MKIDITDLNTTQPFELVLENEGHRSYDLTAPRIPCVGETIWIQAAGEIRVTRVEWEAMGARADGSELTATVHATPTDED